MLAGQFCGAGLGSVHCRWARSHVWWLTCSRLCRMVSAATAHLWLPHSSFSVFIFIHPLFSLFNRLTQACSHDSIRTPHSEWKPPCKSDYEIPCHCLYHILLAKSCHSPAQTLRRRNSTLDGSCYKTILQRER